MSWDVISKRLKRPFLSLSTLRLFKKIVFSPVEILQTVFLKYKCLFSCWQPFTASWQLQYSSETVQCRTPFACIYAWELGYLKYS